MIRRTRKIKRIQIWKFWSRKLKNWKTSNMKTGKQSSKSCVNLWKIILFEDTNFSQSTKKRQKLQFICGLSTKTCEFGAMKNQMIRNRIVCGINDSKSQILLFLAKSNTETRSLQTTRKCWKCTRAKTERSSACCWSEAI